MSNHLKFRQRGFAIADALIAFGVIIIAGVALFALQGNLMNGSRSTKAHAEALIIARDHMELWRNYVEKDQYLSSLTEVQQNEEVDGVNATYIVSYTFFQDNDDDPPVLSEIDDTANPPSVGKTQKLTVRVTWNGVELDSDENPVEENVTLTTELYYTKPEVATAIASQKSPNSDPSDFSLRSPWITGVEDVHDSTEKIKEAQEETGEGPVSATEPFHVMNVGADGGATVDSEDVSIITYTHTYTIDGNTYARSNVEVVHNGEVKLTSFGGRVLQIKGSIIVDNFSLVLDVNGDGVYDENEIKNYWTDAANEDIDPGEVSYTDSDGVVTVWNDDEICVDCIPDDGLIQTNEFDIGTTLDTGPDGIPDGIIDETEIGGYWADVDNGVIDLGEVSYWLDANSDGHIDDTELHYWVDLNGDGLVNTTEFIPPLETSGAKSSLTGNTHLELRGSSPSYCVFPICENSMDTDHDCRVSVDALNPDLGAYQVANYVCYVPGDCTYGGDGCPEGFIPPDNGFGDLNGGWYGRLGNFNVQLTPDDMVCTANTYKQGSVLFLTPSREYVTHRWGFGCEGDLSKTHSQCPEANWKWTVIHNEGINTPYSNQSFFIVRKNNKPQDYCADRAADYPELLVDEQIKRELGKLPVGTSKAGAPNVVLPVNLCTGGLSCL